MAWKSGIAGGVCTPLPGGAEEKTWRKEEERRKQPPLSINSNAINLMTKKYLDSYN